MSCCIQSGFTESKEECADFVSNLVETEVLSYLTLHLKDLKNGYIVSQKWQVSSQGIKRQILTNQSLSLSLNNRSFVSECLAISRSERIN